MDKIGAFYELHYINYIVIDYDHCRGTRMSFKKVATIASVLFIISQTAAFAGINEQGLGLFNMASGENGTAGNVLMQMEDESGPDFGTVENGTTQKLSKEIRKNAVCVSGAWNGLAGIGLMYTYRPDAKVAVDAGLGIGGTGIKLGFRGRYCFSSAKGSPFAGLGYIRGSGSAQRMKDYKLAIPDGGEASVDFTLNPVNFIQLSGGYDYVANNGFTFVFAVGWAVALNDGLENVLFYGDYTPDEYRDIDEDAVDFWETVAGLSFYGGLVLELNFGFAF